MEPVEIREGRGGKSAFISGTRVRVSDIARLHELLETEMVAERIREALPHLTQSQIRAAIDYWRANRKAIAKEIEAEETILSTIPSKL